MQLNTTFIKKLRDSGLRPTKQRLKICEVLFNTEKTFHFTINDLSKIISEKLFWVTSEDEGLGNPYMYKLEVK